MLFLAGLTSRLPYSQLMKINKDHWLDPVIREELDGGAEMNTRRVLVIHFTSGATAKSSIDFWRSPEAKGASAHIVIDRDGTIYQCRPFNRTCGHAGASSWKDKKTGLTHVGLNSCSIGIELANAGDSPKLAERWSKMPPVLARHKNGGPLVKWEAYPAAQLISCEQVSRLLVTRYNLDAIVGHDDIAPSRKVDPGPAFDMSALQRACGLAA